MVKFFIFCTKVFAVSTLLFANYSIVSGQPDPSYVLPAGKRIKVRMDTEINSNANRAGDTFIVKVIEPVRNGSMLAVPAGTIIDGRILAASDAEYGSVDGKLDVEFFRLRLDRDYAISLDAKLVRPAKPPSRSLFRLMTIGGLTAIGAAFGAASNIKNGTAIGAAIGAGSGSGIAFGRKGADVRIKTNAEFEIEIKKEVVLPAIKEF